MAHCCNASQSACRCQRSQRRMAVLRPNLGLALRFIQMIKGVNGEISGIFCRSDFRAPFLLRFGVNGRAAGLTPRPFLVPRLSGRKKMETKKARTFTRPGFLAFHLAGQTLAWRWRVGWRRGWLSHGVSVFHFRQTTTQKKARKSCDFRASWVGRVQAATGSRIISKFTATLFVRLVVQRSSVSSLTPLSDQASPSWSLNLTVAS